MKKIGILTQPLKNNYGGLLQAFALQKYLSSVGYDVLTIDLIAKHDKPSIKKVVRGVFTNIIKKYMLRKNVTSILPQYENPYTSAGVQTRRFVMENLRTTHKLMDTSELAELGIYSFDAYVVGSDQVWRSIYSPNITSFFLDFLKDDHKTKKIAYAASFGVDNCDEYTKEELNECSKLAKKFDAISVRENSAVELCKKYFQVETKQIIDPTLLLNQSDYIDLVNRDCVEVSRGNMMVYVLDEAPDKRQMIDKIAQVKGLTPYALMPIQGEVFPSVTSWIRGFMDAEYVVTDSFHGVVFSIIFNKQFIAIGNRARGLARFTSILNKFNLLERLVIDIDDLDDKLIEKNIDFSKVNEIKKAEQNFAFSFLKESLSSKY